MGNRLEDIVKPNYFLAHRKRYSFASSAQYIDKYRRFLSTHLMELKPVFYSVVSKREIDTTDGPMCVVKLVLDTADPQFDVIAECFINGSHIYFWQNKCWELASSYTVEDIEVPCLWLEPCGTLPECATAKLLVIYSIGDVHDSPRHADP